MPFETGAWLSRGETRTTRRYPIRARSSSTIRTCLSTTGETTRSSCTRITTRRGSRDGTLSATVSFSGGCARHRFTLVANRRFTASDPVQIDVSLAHEANDDRCEAYLTEMYEFDLVPIEMRYRQVYGRSEGAIGIRLLGRNRPEGLPTLHTLSRCLFAPGHGQSSRSGWS